MLFYIWGDFMASNFNDKRVGVCISLTESEKNEIKTIAKGYGLSLSAFIRLAAKEYAVKHSMTTENDKKGELTI